MTSARTSLKIQKHPAPLRALAYTYMTLFVAILFFKNTSLTASFVSSGLSLCAKKLIPSLFPFMVLSSIIIKSGACTTLFSVLSKPLCFVFGISADGTRALLLGWLCGFPVGAKCACDLLCDGKIGSREYNTLLCISSTPSPAFLVGTVGAGMLGESSVGLCLYLCSLFSCTLIGILLRLIHRKKPLPQTKKATAAKAPGLSKILTQSVTESGMGMLNICAFVVFFSAFLGTLEGVIAPLKLGQSATALIFGFFEISMGTGRICALPREVALPLAAMAVGWSGLSVHLQTAAICHTSSCKFGAYLLSHAAKAAICALVFVILF